MPFAKGGRRVHEADGTGIAGSSLPSPQQVRNKTEEGPVELETPNPCSNEDTTTCKPFAGDLQS